MRIFGEAPVSAALERSLIIVLPFDFIRVNLLNKMNEINYNFCVGNRQTFMDHQRLGVELGCGEWN